MEIKEENKFKKFFKRFGAVSLACVFAIAIALTIALSIPNEGDQPASTKPIAFALPMNEAVVVKDYSEDKLQYNSSLERWEIHLGVDLSSENATVLSIADGVVSSVETNSLEGSVVTIQHENGYVSIYSSLSEQLKVKEGDKVSRGQEIGQASDSASNENKTGGHLHLVMMKDGQEIDPNDHLDLQNK